MPWATEQHLASLSSRLPHVTSCRITTMSAMIPSLCMARRAPEQGCLSIEVMRSVHIKVNAGDTKKAAKGCVSLELAVCTP
jgi:hypothetical protein